MKNRATKYARIGEFVNLRACHEFIRCGYPLSVKDVWQQEQETIRKLAIKASKVIAPVNSQTENEELVFAIRGQDSFIHEGGRVFRMIEAAIATYLLEKKGFGGKDRIIVERKLDDPKSYVDRNPWLVVGKKFVKTGERYPPYSSSYGEEWDWEPGGLKDEQTHCVYQIERKNMRLWVLAKHCERLNRHDSI